MKRNCSPLIIVLIPFLSLISCTAPIKPDLEGERRKLLQLDEQARNFHFSKNAKAMADGFSSDFISIDRGVISHPSYDESLQRFDKYFKRVEFIKWDNNTPPVIRFSDDASMAYMAVDKSVILKTNDENGSEIMDTTHFAWLSVFKKINGKWVLDGISSTNK